LGRDRYAPPRSVLREGSSLGERGVRTSAIAVGVVSDFVATLVGLVGLGITLSVAASGSGAAEAAGSFTAALAALLETESVQFSLVGINASAAAIGGFASGSAAGRAQVRHAFLTGSVILALGLFFAFESPDELSNWDTLLSLAVTIPAALIGGWLSRGRRR
jgi:hypothetical protein